MENTTKRLNRMKVCLTCGSKGYSAILIYCKECQIVAMHRYCVDGPTRYDDKNITWTCEDCVPKTVKQPSRMSERISSTVDQEALRKKARRSWRVKFDVLNTKKANHGKEHVAIDSGSEHVAIDSGITQDHARNICKRKYNKKDTCSYEKKDEDTQVHAKGSFMEACNAKEETVGEDRQARAKGSLMEACNAKEEIIINTGKHRVFGSEKRHEVMQTSKRVHHMDFQTTRNQGTIKVDYEDKRRNVLTQGIECKLDLMGYRRQSQSPKLKKERLILEMDFEDKSDSFLIKERVHHLDFQTTRNHGTMKVDYEDEKSNVLIQGIECKLDLMGHRRQSQSPKPKKERLILEMDFEDESPSLAIKERVHHLDFQSTRNHGTTKVDYEDRKRNLLIQGIECKLGLMGYRRQSQSPKPKKERSILEMDSEVESDSLAIKEMRSSSGISNLKNGLILEMDSNEEIDCNLTAKGNDGNGALPLLVTSPQIKPKDHIPTQPLHTKLFKPSGIHVPSIQYVGAQPVIDSIWRGSYCIELNSHRVSFGIEAHLSNIVDPKVQALASALPKLIDFRVVLKKDAWPKAFEKSPPTSHKIGLYFFPMDERDHILYDRVLELMDDQHLVLVSKIDDLELLVFTSQELPQEQWRFRRKYYMWGVFKQYEKCSRSRMCPSIQIGDIALSILADFIPLDDRQEKDKDLNINGSYRCSLSPLSMDSSSVTSFSSSHVHLNVVNWLPESTPPISLKSHKALYNNEQSCDSEVESIKCKKIHNDGALKHSHMFAM